MATDITQTISSAPTAPSRQDPDTFSDRSDAFVGYIEDMPDELNTLSGQINTIAGEAEDARDKAEEWADKAEDSEVEAGKYSAKHWSAKAEEQKDLAAQQVLLAESAANASALSANAVVWSSGDSWSAGDVVLDPNADYRAYTAQQAHSQTIQPNTDDGTYWKITVENSIKGGSGGASTVSTSSDITLSSTSNFVQEITTTAYGCYIYLPDATTMATGLCFLIKNAGENQINIKDNSSKYLYSFSSGDYCFVQLLDRTTSDGTWQIFTLSSNETDSVDYFLTTLFESGGTSYISVATLSSTQAIVCFRDGSDSNKGKACLLDIDGTTITPGTAIDFESGATTYISVATLSSTQAVVCFTDQGDSNKGKACLLDIDGGTTITPGTAVDFESGATLYNSVTILSSTQAVVCFTDQGDSSKGKACLLDIDGGTTITPGTAVEFESGATGYVSATTLSNTQAIVCFSDTGDSNKGKACLLDIDGGITITPGTAVDFESGVTTCISVTKLSSTQAVVCFTDQGDSNKGKACLLDIDGGTTITPGTAVEFESRAAINISVTILSSTQAVVCFADSDDSSEGKVCLLDIDGGTTIIPGTAVEFESGNTSYISVTTFSSTQAVVCFADNSDSGKGKCYPLTTNMF